MSGVEAAGRRTGLSLYSAFAEPLTTGEPLPSLSPKVDNSLLLKNGKEVVKLSLLGLRLPGYKAIL
jgi:hypothetical protein